MAVLLIQLADQENEACPPVSCSAGVGAMVLPKALHFHPLLNALVPINIDISAYGAGELSLVVHKRQAYLPKVRIVINAIKECFKEIEAGIWKVTRALGDEVKEVKGSDSNWIDGVSVIDFVVIDGNYRYTHNN